MNYVGKSSHESLKTIIGFVYSPHKVKNDGVSYHANKFPWSDPHGCPRARKEKAMNNKSQMTNSKNQKHSHQEKGTSGIMRIFYILMLLLVVASTVIRLTGMSRPITPGKETPAPQVGIGNGEGTAARALVFHRRGNGANACEDLVIAAPRNAVLGNCGSGIEKQYSLNEEERAQLQTWLEKLKAINYEHKDETSADGVNI